MTGRIPHPYPDGEAMRFIEGTRRRNGEGQSLALLMALKGDPDTAVGALGLDMQRQPGSPRLGYWVGKPYWGRGLATEAAQALIDFGFLFTEAGEITATARVINPASRRVLEKCGFAYLGCGLESLPARGGMSPCDRFRLDRKAWSSLKGWRVPEWVRAPVPSGEQAGCPA
jgi:RimJ/RimL family protein N-acetyltransferase